MAKKKPEIQVTTVFDGELDAADVLLNLITKKVQRHSENSYQDIHLDKTKEFVYHASVPHYNQIPSGLCG